MPIIYECDKCGKQSGRAHVYMAHKTEDVHGIEKESTEWFGIPGWDAPKIQAGAFRPSPGLLEDEKVVCQQCMAAFFHKEEPPVRMMRAKSVKVPAKKRNRKRL